MNPTSHRYQRYFQNLGQLYQQKKVRSYTEIVATLGAIIFFLIFAIKPTLTTITRLLKEIDDKRSVEVKLDQKIKALMEAQKIYVNLESSLPLMAEALPNQPQLSLYLKQLEALAQKDNVELLTLQTAQLVLKDTPPPDQNHFAPTFTLNGTYGNLQNFLNDLHRLRRLTELTSFAFKTDPQTPDSLNLTLTAKVYIFAQANVSR
jgi:Tfp pilus assembly protein PilO